MHKITVNNIKLSCMVTYDVYVMNRDPCRVESMSIDASGAGKIHGISSDLVDSKRGPAERGGHTVV